MSCTTITYSDLKAAVDEEATNKTLEGHRVRKEFVHYDGGDYPTVLLGWGGDEVLTLPFFKQMKQMDLPYMKNPDTNKMEASPVSGFGLYGRATLISVLSAIFNSPEADDDPRVHSAACRMIQFLLDHSDFDEAKIKKIKEHQFKLLCCPSTAKESAFAIRAVPCWDSWVARENREVSFTESLLRHRHVGGNWGESAPFNDIWMMQKESPEIYRAFKEAEIAESLRIIGLLEQYKIQMYAPAVNVQKTELGLVEKTLKQVLDTYGEPGLAKLAFEILEQDKISLQLREECKHLRRMYGTKWHLSLDDASEESSNHNVGSIYLHDFLEDKVQGISVINAVKLDGLYIASLCGSASKAGFPDPKLSSALRFTGFDSPDHQEWLRKIDNLVMFLNRLHIDQMAVAEFSLDAQKEHHLLFINKMAEKGKLLLGGEDMDMVKPEFRLTGKIAKMVVQGGMTNAQAFDFEIFQRAAEIASSPARKNTDSEPNAESNPEPKIGQKRSFDLM